MTISRQLTKRIYSGNGTSREWAVDFPLMSLTDLNIIVTSPAGVETTVTTGYEWDEENQVITYPTVDSELDVLGEGWTITLVRQTPLTQEMDLLRQGDFDAEALEQGYDKLTLISQELNEKLNRCLKYPVSSSVQEPVLSSSQIAAINSGATSTNVAQVATNTNQIAALQLSKLDKSEASQTYATQTALTDGLATKQPVGNYATVNDLTTGLAAKLDTSTAASTYLSQTDAASTYLTQSNASSTYLTQANAASTYATQSALTSGLAGKQDTLSTAQLAAVNSGVTTSTVSQVATNLNYLTGFAPYIQKYEVGNFNTQQTVDATDLLAATGALHALDLDLSKNTQLKKLTAKGTSGNLANVSSVLVSNEAPFDNATSPQLDVSYTGLNKAALVNLFNSMPYNVGYTVVGSPTITDGVISGIDLSNYAITSQAMDQPDYFEEVCEFTMPNSWVGTSSIKTLLVNGNARGLDIYNPSPGVFFLHCYLRFTDNTDGGYWINNVGLQAGQTYTGKLIRNNDTEYVLELWQNGSKIQEKVINETKKMLNNSAIFIGSSSSTSYFEGSINLNNTYIKENGVPWFTGKAAITKTCSVVGCTGTADLTQDDKNIALNKGWALTVA